MPSTKQYFAYILECLDGTLYTGITTNVKRRFTEHKQGIGSSYTKSHGAKKVVYVEELPDRSTASKREYEIKQLSRKQKLKLITKG